METSSLGDRMKAYESITQTNVMRRTPVIVRLDGRAFHTFARRIKRIDPTLTRTPFSCVLHAIMNDTARALYNNVQNCVFAYVQSDEISLLLRDWNTHETQQWFGGNVQKIVSVSAAIATAAFNASYFEAIYATAASNALATIGINSHSEPDVPHLSLRFEDMATFDSRIYNLPKEEVANYFIWRQQDASRNSVQMLGHYHFSQKVMHGKDNSEVQELLFSEKDINWDDIDTWMKRGSCIVDGNVNGEIPIFTQDRNFIERHLTVSEW